MIEAEKLRWDHLERIDPQASQKDALTLDVKAQLAKAGGWAGVEDGTIIGIFSLPEITPGRVVAYTILSKHMETRHLKFLARQARCWLYEWGRYRRVEAYVLEDAEREMFWCEKVLGLELEAKLRQWTVDGRACYIYSRIAEE